MADSNTATDFDILKDIPKPRVSQLGELKTANHLLGDRRALDEFWQQNGYWYFKKILPEDVIGQLREVWIDYLQRLGLIDANTNQNRYNGAPITQELGLLPEFNERDIQRLLTENPAVNAVFNEILGDEPFWLSIAEYRANSPGGNPDENRFIFPHQDGFYSRDMPMRICWIPVDAIDREVGGCAFAEGSHCGPLLHDLSQAPFFPIPAERLPSENWKVADYEPGDLVMFDLNTLHSGLTNVSKDRFRMSFDVRVTEASGQVPTIGELVSLTQDRVTVRNSRTGTDESYAVNDYTYVRGNNGKKREGADIPTTFEAGERVIVNSKDGVSATLVRTTH